ncbi:hypothetical protein [Aquirufa ecclesiirivi]|uniref:hypothetical protein n=1 Tax=Aquirufa ecclesiirivi TaxID=2715124 RepID=UPI00140C289F|nr:hypothetical protein [Aquirufa ecclesiirivi]NHC49995.1 hypothetical protein [Aquirufa ecclesiirivi]
MDAFKQQQVLVQYINQYKPVIDKTLTALRANKGNLHIPYAQFLFSVIDYYGLLYIVATTRRFNKRDKNNFLDFFASSYFPSVDTCKKSFLYFVRNGIIHQIFSKASSVGTSAENKLFFKDTSNGNIPALNLDYLDKVTISAIDNFSNDLKTNSTYIDNLHDILLVTNYGLNDHVELTSEFDGSFIGDINKVFDDCI